MYTPIKLEIENFGSFEKAELKFDQNKATLIQGINSSDPGSKSNGSGKSTFEGAIYYALIGSSIDKKKKDAQLIRRGKESAKVKLQLKNSIFKHVLTIERTIQLKGSSTLNIEVNKESYKDRFATVSDGNKLILSLLDISINDLQSYYLINADRFVSFFNIPDNSKKDFIGKFSNANVIKDLDPLFEKEINQIELNLNELQNRKSELAIENNFYRDKLEVLNDKDYVQIQENFQREKKEINKQSTLLVAQMKQEKEDLVQKEMFLDKEIVRLDKWISILDQMSYEKIFKDFDEKRSHLKKKIDELRLNDNEFTEDLNICNTKLIKVNLSLESKIQCPKCNHIFNLQDKNFDFDKYQKFKCQIGNEIIELQDILKELSVELDKEQKEDSQILDQKRYIESRDKRRRQLLKNCNDQMQQFSNQRRSIQSKINELDRRILEKTPTINFSVEILKSEDQKERLLLKEKLIQIESEIIKNETSLSLKLEEKDEKVMWKSTFKQYYTYLINKSLLCLENQVNVFLERMNTNLSISIEGYKLLSNKKDIRENINVLVRRNGFVEDEISTYSSGEKGRLICAMILANQEIINSKSKSGGLNLLIIDEVLDSIDSLGMQLLVSSLSTLNKIIFIITHIYLEKVEEEMNVNILTIQKEKGVSSIIGLV